MRRSAYSRGTPSCCDDRHTTDERHPEETLCLLQSTRWIMTKEEHCSRIITKIAEYCLCQRVKAETFATPGDYADALKAHHAVMQCAMKAKVRIVFPKSQHCLPFVQSNHS